MAIDASIYQNVKPIQIDIPSPVDAAQKAMTLSQMGMQQRQMALQLQTQQAMRDAYSNNMGPDGSLNKQGFLSDLGRVNPQAAMDYSQQFNKMEKNAADAQNSKLEAVQKIVGQTLPAMNYLAGLSEDERSKAYPVVMKQLSDQGIPTQNIPRDANGNFIYDPDTFKQHYGILQNTAQNIANMKTQADIGKTQADTALTQAQTGKVPSEIAKTQADTAYTQAQTKKVPAEIAKIQADTGEIFDKRAQNLKDDLDPNKARGGNLAKSQSVINAADRLNAMFKQFPDYNIPKAQQTELVSAFGAILNGGSAPLQSQLEELVPKSARGDANALAAWVTNNPLGQDQQKFMQLLHESVGRERDVAENQVKTAQVQRLSAHKLLKNTDPETYNSILNSYGIQPSDIKNGKYAPSNQGDGNETSPSPIASKRGSADLVQSANAASGSGGISAHDALALQWVQNPKNASSPQAFKIRSMLRAKGLLK